MTILKATITTITTATVMAIIIIRSEPKIMQIVNKLYQLMAVKVLLFCNQIIFTNK